MQVEAPEINTSRESALLALYIYISPCLEWLGGSTIDNLPNRGTQIFKSVQEDDESTLEKHSDHLIKTPQYENTLIIEVEKC